MAWGTLKTWVVNELVTAAMMNEQIRDKFAELWKYQNKGDLMVASGPNSLVRLAPGVNGQALLADSTAAAGVRWGQNGPTLPPGPVFAYKEKYPTTEWTSSSATYSEVFGAGGFSVPFTLASTARVCCWCTGVFRPTQLYGGCSVKLRLDDATDSAVDSSKSCNSSSTDISWIPFSLVWQRTGVAAGAHTVRLLGAQTAGANFGAIEVQKASLLVIAYP